MPVTPPKCKFCPELHWERICPNIGKQKIRVFKVPDKPPAPKAVAALPPPPKKARKK